MNTYAKDLTKTKESVYFFPNPKGGALTFLSSCFFGGEKMVGGRDGLFAFVDTKYESDLLFALGRCQKRYSMNKNFIKLSFLLFLLCLVFQLGAFEFTSGGKALFEIVLPDDAVEMEQRAADEVADNIQKIAGCRPSIIREKEARSLSKAIYIGQTRYASTQHIEYKTFVKEEWLIRTVGGDLILTGGRPVGGYYAARRMLQQIGCWELAPDVEIHPETKDLSVNIEDERLEPSFKGRLIYDSVPTWLNKIKADKKDWEAWQLWSLRSFQNGRQENHPSLYIGEIYDICYWPQYHNLSLYVNPDKYFDSHPEYFSMDDKGKRYKPRTLWEHGSLCVSNPEVKRITLESLREMIRKNRKENPPEKWSHIFDISILDGTPYICHCPECKAITAEEGSESGLFLRYINYVAEHIAEEYPDVTIRTFVYGCLAKPPAVTRPVKNVLCQTCDDFPNSDCFRPLDSKFNPLRKKYFDEWAAIASRMMVWDYWNMGGGFFNPPRVETLTDAIAPDFRYFKSRKVEALFLEAERDRVAPQNFINLNYFLASQLMLLCDADPEPLIRLFLKGFYGPGVGEVALFLEELRKGVAEHPGRQCNMYVGRWNYMTPQFALRHYKSLRKAAERCPDGGEYRKRVQFEMIPLMWSSLKNWQEFGAAFEAAGIAREQLLSELEQYCLLYINRYKGENDALKESNFERRFMSVKVHIPIPPEFKEFSSENIRVFGYPDLLEERKLHSEIVDDPDSPLGKALCSSTTAPDHHGVKTIYRIPSRNYECRVTRFSIEGENPKRSLHKILESVEQDEKYHWYSIPNIELSSKTLFVGHFWLIKADLSSAYQITDGVSQANRWDCHFSAKFTGPAWVPGSTQKNAIWIDRIVLTRGK